MKNEWQLPALGSEEIGKCSYKCDSYDIIPARILHYPNLLEWRCSQLFCYMGFNLFPHCSLLPYRNFITWCLFFFFLPLASFGFSLVPSQWVETGAKHPKKCPMFACCGQRAQTCRGCQQWGAERGHGGDSGWHPQLWSSHVGSRMGTLRVPPMSPLFRQTRAIPSPSKKVHFVTGREMHPFRRKFS